MDMDFFSKITPEPTDLFLNSEKSIAFTVLPFIVRSCFRLLQEGPEQLLYPYLLPFSNYTLSQNEFKNLDANTRRSIIKLMRLSLRNLQSKLHVQIIDQKSEYIAFIKNSGHDHIQSPEINFTLVAFDILYNQVKTIAEAHHALLELCNAFFHELGHLWFRTKNVCISI